MRFMVNLASNDIFHELFGYRSHYIINELIKVWKSPVRFYHSFDNHLAPMIDRIRKLPTDPRSKNLLEIAAWFHDCIYYPKSENNESDSVKFFTDRLDNKHRADADIVRDLIEMTVDFKCDTPLKIHFANLDLDYLNHTNVRLIVQNELLLLKEFQFVNYSVYKQRRLDIMRRLSKSERTSESTVRQIIDYLGSHRPRIGIYPGSFNPFHVGHLSILQEAEKMFDKVIVAIGINPEKQLDNVCASGRLEQIKNVLPYHQVEFFSTFLHEYVEKKSKDADVTVIRGFRSGYDIDYELTNLAFIRDMSKDLKVMFIAPHKKFDHISSSALRLIKNFSEKQSETYVPKVYYPCP